MSERFTPSTCPFVSSPTILPTILNSCTPTFSSLLLTTPLHVANNIPPCCRQHPSMLPTTSLYVANNIPPCCQQHPSMLPTTPLHVADNTPSMFADVESQAELCMEHLKGFCPRGPFCPWRHSRQDATIVCKHWLRHLCKKGDDCEFLHLYDMMRMPECHYYQKYGE